MRTITHITLALGLIMAMQAKLVVVDLDNREDMRQLSSLIGKGKIVLVSEIGHD